MANSFVALPVPAGDGVGAWVDTSALGATKTISVDGGAFSGTLFIESSNDARASAAPVNCGSFSGGTAGPVEVVAAVQFMRVRRTLSSGAPLGAPSVKVGAETVSGQIFAAMPAPAGDGAGAGVDLSAGGQVQTFNVVGPYTGQVVIEVSTDAGTTWSPALLFGLPSVVTPAGGTSANFAGVVAQVRVRRQGTIPGPVPVISVGSGTDSGSGGSGGTATLFDLELSYGNGILADQQLPTGQTFWLTPTTIADLAVANQVREWPVDKDLNFVQLSVTVNSSTGAWAAPLPLIVTVDEVDTAITVAIPTGIVDETVFTSSAAIAVAAGSNIGVRVDTNGLPDPSTLQLEARVTGSNAGPSGGLAFVTHDFTLQGSGTPSDPLGTNIRTLAGVNGVQVAGDGAGNYTFRGSYVSLPGGSGLGATRGGGGLYSIDIAGVGRQFDASRQLLGCFALNALVLNNSQPFDWSPFSTAYKTSGYFVIIEKAWAVVRQLGAGAVVTAPVFSLSIGGTGNVVTPFGPTAAQINNNAALGVPYAIPLDVVGKTGVTIQDLVNGAGGGATPPGLTGKVTTAATGPAQLDIVIMLAIELDVSSASNP